MDLTIETIPDSDDLYKRVHQVHITQHGIEPNAFKNLPKLPADQKESEYMSVDWAKYSTPEETRAREGKADFNAVVLLKAGKVRSLPEQRIEHLPIPANRSHSGVIGRKTARVRIALSRICIVVIPLEKNAQQSKPPIP